MRSFILVLVLAGCGGSNHGTDGKSSGGQLGTGPSDPAWEVSKWCFRSPDHVEITVSDAAGSGATTPYVSTQWAFDSGAYSQIQTHESVAHPMTDYLVFPVDSSELHYRTITGIRDPYVHDAVINRWAGPPCE